MTVTPLSGLAEERDRYDMELHTFEQLRARAIELADTARFNHWEEVAGEMEREGYLIATKRLGSDPILRTMLNARCALARDRHS